MNTPWYQDAIFYHIYPLGLCGAPMCQEADAPVTHRLDRLVPWLQHAKSLGATAIYLGPVFESVSHGYDTADYYHIDRRLGDRDSFRRFADSVHQQGMKLVLDGVFNHVGRSFWAFQEVLEKGEKSPYVNWFRNLRFGEHSPMGDPFSYGSWQGHFDLVELNLSNTHVREHLFGAVEMWMNEFGIDGLRLDAADCLDFDFLRALRKFVKAHRGDFWIMGEVVHGDYRDWVNPETLDSVTNYECYKGLYSSLNADNYYEIAYSLNRQFGEEGIYKSFPLYNFVDNHDVNRVASQLESEVHLYPLYVLLFTMPGIPSVYYGSEWGIRGIKGDHSDEHLRPRLELDHISQIAPQPDLEDFVRTLSRIRHEAVALRHGNFQTLHIDHQQFAFTRKSMDDEVLVALNSSEKPADLDLCLPAQAQNYIDLLNQGDTFQISNGKLQVRIHPNGGRILKRFD